MKKHTYLIMAHNEFEVLKELLLALDDDRNDIYIHFDKKVKQIPEIKLNKSNLYILENRVDVRWGHVSQIEAEYALFEQAFKNNEESTRYHLISGTHFPLKSQDEIHFLFDQNPGKEILSFIYTNDYEVKMKLGRYHFFLRNYKHNNIIVQKISHFLWLIILKIQNILNIYRIEDPKVTIKANNWVSLTRSALAYIIDKKKEVLQYFRWSFCGDEYFVPYLLENSEGKFEIINMPDLLFNDFVDGSPRILKDEDYEFLINSNYLFARKFSTEASNIVKKIVKKIKSES
ncbi:beta-1,6-N-acetylglucosaminyltransferase [Elizabethkingia meningoseptica]|uniref:beta-1,6-N-acetylglucosaminyltransferase n=1 Tax=Elizabethkingia meningoseptica TaxID=238 RepID=UPI003892A6B7